MPMWGGRSRRIISQTGSYRQRIKHGFLAQRKSSSAAGAAGAFHGRSRLPGGAALRRRDGKKPSGRQSLEALRGGGGPEAQGKGGESVESLPAALRARRRTLQPRVRAAVRDHGTLASRTRGLQ